MWMRPLPEATWFLSKLRHGSHVARKPRHPHPALLLKRPHFSLPFRAFLCPQPQTLSYGGPGHLGVWPCQEKSSGKEKQTTRRQRTDGSLPVRQEQRVPPPLPGRAHTRGNGTHKSPSGTKAVCL